MSAGYMRKCIGKVRYEDKASAEKNRSSLVASGKWAKSNTNVYRCNQCGGYHTGHVGRGRRSR